jgi:hypothetical protein
MPGAGGGPQFGTGLSWAKKEKVPPFSGRDPRPLISPKVNLRTVIGEILWTPAANLAATRPVREMRRFQPSSTIYNVFNAALPSCIKLNPGDLRKDVNRNCLVAHVEKRPTVSEVSNSQPLKRCTDLGQRRVKRFRISRRLP